MYIKLDTSFCNWQMVKNDPLAALIFILIVSKAGYQGEDRGVAYLSLRDLAEMVGKTEKTISGKLKKLEDEGCIRIMYANGRKNSPQKSAINITNYDKYQSSKKAQDTPVETTGHSSKNYESTPVITTEDSGKNYGTLQKKLPDTPVETTGHSSKNYESSIPYNNRITELQNTEGENTRPRDDDIPRQPYSPMPPVMGVQPRVPFPNDWKEVQTRAAIAGIVMGDEEAMKFFDYYASHGWMDGRTAILDWTRKLRGWHEQQKKIDQRNAGAQQQEQNNGNNGTWRKRNGEWDPKTIGTFGDDDYLHNDWK